MGILKNAFRSELIKLRFSRAVIPSAAVLFAVFILVFLISAYAGRGIFQRTTWEDIIGNAHVLKLYAWIVPVLCAYMTESLLELEGSNNCWNRMLTLPVPRWTVYCVKAFLIHNLVFITGVVAGFCLIISGFALHIYGPDIQFEGEFPWLACVRGLVFFHIASFALIPVYMIIGIKIPGKGAAIVLAVVMALMTDRFLNSFGTINLFNLWQFNGLVVQAQFAELLVIRIVLGIILSFLGMRIFISHEFD